MNQQLLNSANVDTKLERFFYADMDMKSQVLNSADIDVKPPRTPNIIHMADVKTYNFNFHNIDTRKKVSNSIDVKPILLTSSDKDYDSENIGQNILKSVSITSAFEEKYLENDIHSKNLYVKCNESESFLQEQSDVNETAADIKPNLCKICQNCFFQNSLKQSNSQAESICKSCQEKLQGKVQEITSTDVYVCKICHESFKNDFDLKFHLLIHSNDEQMLPEIFDDNCERNNLSECRTKLTNRFHTCEFCGECFMDKLSLDRHYLIHSKQRKNKYICDICNAFFKKALSLSKHKKRFHYVTCKLCFASYFTQKELKSHELLHMKLTKKMHAIHNTRIKIYGLTSGNKL